MTEEDKAGFELAEAEELFMATSRPDPTLPPERWTTEALERIKKKVNPPTGADKTKQEGETEQTGNERDISLRIKPYDFIKIFRKWKESTFLVVELGRGGRWP